MRKTHRARVNSSNNYNMRKTQIYTGGDTFISSQDINSKPRKCNLCTKPNYKIISVAKMLGS